MLVPLKLGEKRPSEVASCHHELLISFEQSEVVSKLVINVYVLNVFFQHIRITDSTTVGQLLSELSRDLERRRPHHSQIGKLGDGLSLRILISIYFCWDLVYPLR